MAPTTVDAAAGSALTRSVIGEAAVYPVVAATSDAAIVAWTSGASTNSTIQVTRVAR
jgi:hypothetical protein